MEENIEKGQKKEGENYPEDKESKPHSGNGDDEGKKNEVEDESEKKENDVPTNLVDGKTESSQNFEAVRQQNGEQSTEDNTEVQENGVDQTDIMITGEPDSSQQDLQEGGHRHKLKPTESLRQTGTEGSGPQRKLQTASDPAENAQHTGTEGSGPQQKSQTASTDPAENAKQTGTVCSGPQQISQTATDPWENAQQIGSLGSVHKQKSQTATDPTENAQQTGSLGSVHQQKSQTATDPAENAQLTVTDGSGSRQKSQTATDPAENAQLIGTDGSGPGQKSQTATDPAKSARMTVTDGSGSRQKSQTATDPAENAQQTGTEKSGPQHISQTATDPAKSAQHTGTDGSGPQQKYQTATDLTEKAQQTGTDGSVPHQNAQTATDPAENAKQTGSEGSVPQQKSQTATDPAENAKQTGPEGSGPQQKSQTATDPAKSAQQTGTDGIGPLQKSQTATDPAENAKQTGSEGSGPQQISQTATDPAKSAQHTGTDGSGPQQKYQTATDLTEKAQQTGTDGSVPHQNAQTATDPAENAKQTGSEGSGPQQKSQTATDPAENAKQTGSEGSGPQQKSQTATDPAKSAQQTGTDGIGPLQKSQTATDPAENAKQTGSEGSGPQQKSQSCINPVLNDLKTDPSNREPSSGSKDSRDGRPDGKKSEENMRAEENKANEEKMKNEGAVASEDGAVSGVKQPSEDLTKEDTERPVSISLCTSAYQFNVRGLLSYLEDVKDDNMLKDGRKLIKEVKVHELPYNDLDHYEFPANNPVDVMVLCHSINNRRFAITDVMDALYDKYLPYCQRVIGKEKMGVIVHDFDDMREPVMSSRMKSFEHKQPTAFQTTSLQILCGHIETKEQVKKQIQRVDRGKLIEFIKDASKSKWQENNTTEQPRDNRMFPDTRDRIATFQGEVISFLFGGPKTSAMGSQDSTWEGSSVDQISEVETKDEDRVLVGEGQKEKTKRSAIESQSQHHDAKRTCKIASDVVTSGESHKTPQARTDKWKSASVKGQTLDTSNTMAKAHPQGSPSPQPIAQCSGGAVSFTTPAPRRISISVCSSAYEYNVQGFITKINELKTSQPHMISDIRFRSLPYNDIDSFKFPPDDPVDVMILCHSINNRGFSITDVLNALYKKYLQYCHDVIGKKKLAVVVHDFSECKPAIHVTRMESFKRLQPSTFELADTVLVCGNLEGPCNVNIRDEDWTKLTKFFEKARFEPKENYAEKQAYVKKLFGGFW